MAEVCCFPFWLCLPTELWTIVDTPGGESSSPWFRQDLNPERWHLSWSTHHNRSSLQDFLRHDSNKISPGGRADPPRPSPICWRGLWHPSPPGRHRWPLSGPGRAKLQTTRQLRRLKTEVLHWQRPRRRFCSCFSNCEDILTTLFYRLKGSSLQV